MSLFGRRKRPASEPAVSPTTEPERPTPPTLTIGREIANDAPVRWALVDRTGLPGLLAVLAPYELRSRLFLRALPELIATGPLVSLDPLEMLGAGDPFAIHRVGAGRGVNLGGPVQGETVDVARSAQAIAWWASSGAEWSPAVEAILERTLDVLARAGEPASADRLAHLLREAAARSQDPQLRGGCARISEGLFALLGSNEARSLLTDPTGELPSDRSLSLSVAPEIRGDQRALNVALAGLLRLLARLVPMRSGGAALFPSLTDLGPVDSVERLVADLLWPMRSAGIGAIVGAERLSPWESRAGTPSSILARADAWLVGLGEEQWNGWEAILGPSASPSSIGAAFDAIVAAGGDAALIAPSIRREPIGLRAFA